VSLVINDDIIASHRQELRRGTAALACLTLLAAQPDYGYNLIGRLEAIGIEIEANTLYPLLRRLEKQELLSSQWDTTESRPRKFYSTSTQGRSLIALLRRDWDALTEAINQIGDLS
jgi:DNA-binding PadR family transcriptional regulator